MAVAALRLLLFGVLDVTSDVIVISLFIVAPLIVATAADERRTAVFAGLTVALTIGAGWRDGLMENSNYWIRVTAVCAVSVMAVVLAGVRRRREEHLARMTAIAKASQLALLPPLPPEMTGISCMRSSRPVTGSGRSSGTSAATAWTPSCWPGTS